MFHSSGIVYFYGKRVGILTRESNFFRFQYDRTYVVEGGRPISFSLPVVVKPYDSKNLHGFFSGLVAEGWLRKIQSEEQNITLNDEFSLLVNNGFDLAGAVSVLPEWEDYPD